jgi:hypothetical protein
MMKRLQLENDQSPALSMSLFPPFGLSIQIFFALAAIFGFGSFLSNLRAFFHFFDRISNFFQLVQASSSFLQPSALPSKLTLPYLHVP